MEHIDAKPLSIGELLGGKRYSLGYFQREYNWKKDNVADLINDLFGEFLKNHNDESENANSKDFFYFLGSIIVSDKNQKLSLIDGQQRLTTLSLILIWISRTYPEHIGEQTMPLVIHKNENGVRTYALDAPERRKIMDALCDKEEDKINVDNDLTSIQNIKSSFEEIESNIQDYHFSNEKMVTFVHWLKNKVYVAKIEVSSAKDGYKIFETANDRGLNLSPVDMLKSYLLSNIEGIDEQTRLDTIWKSKIDEILNAGEVDSDAIKCWLRATRAESHDDFYDIGSEFHRWVKDKRDSLGLKTSEDFVDFVEKDFCFYIDWYIKIREMAKTYIPENEALYCSASFTLQYPVILSTISRKDDESTILKKINTVSAFIDIFINRNLWRGQTWAIGQRTAKSTMCKIMWNIRRANPRNIASYLQDEVAEYDDFSSHDLPKNKKVIRQFLARFSSFLDAEMIGNDTNLPFYLSSKNCDIEHIIADKYERYEELANEDGELEFDDEDEFQQYRNMIGALLLLTPPTNRNFGDLPYEEKLDYYLTQDFILPKTFHEKAYDRNPQLDKIKERIPFEFHKKFLKADIEKRNLIYTRMAKIIWHPNRIKQAIED